MGYNGNNRGRTHNWSGVGNKRHYNWGLNITARAMVAPFAILGALIELADDIDTSTPKHTSSIKTKSVNTSKKKSLTLINTQPHDLIKTLLVYYPELSQRITRLSKKRNEISSLNDELQSIRRNIFILRKRKRRINALKYRITRKEQFVSSFQIFEEEIIGKPLDRNQINGKVTIHYSDQAMCDFFRYGTILGKQFANFYKGINKVQSLSLKGVDWQMIFYSNGLVFEDSIHILYVPYKDITIDETWIIHYTGCDTHGYDVKSSSWKYTRLDGGPDLRYQNSRIYYVQRYQVEIKFKEIEKESSVYLVFQKKEDAATLCKIISPQTRCEPKKIKKIGYRNF